MIKYKIYIKAVFFILCIVGLYGFANYRNATRKIVDIQIEFEQGDNLYITSEMVNKLLIQSLGNVKNTTKEKLLLRVVEQRIEKNVMIENAEVFVTVDGVLKTKVLQRKPIARIQENTNSYYLDRQGKKMPLSINYSARVPIVTGVKEKTDLEEVYQFVTKVLKDTFMQKQIIAIDINTEKEFLLKTRMGNQLIEFGKLKEIDKKIKKLEAFYQKAIKDKILNKYSKINLKYNKQIVCTNK